MSVVVGYRSRDAVYLASDYQVTSDDGHRDYEAEKIFPGKDYILGVAGDYKIVNLMRHFSFKWPKSADKEKFLVTKLPLMIKEFLSPYKNESGDSEDADSYSILIAYEGGLCEITETFEASLCPIFHAIGTGAPYSFGAYHALSFDFDLDDMRTLELAVGAAIRYNAFCGGGIQIEKMPD